MGIIVGSETYVECDELGCKNRSDKHFDQSTAKHMAEKKDGLYRKIQAKQFAHNAEIKGKNMWIEKIQQDFTWINECEECFEEFECARFIPKKIITKLIKQNSDDVVFDYMAETSNPKVRICPKCRKLNGID